VNTPIIPVLPAPVPATPATEEETGDTPEAEVVSVETSKPTEYNVEVSFCDKEGTTYTVSAKSNTEANLPSKMERTIKAGEEKIVVMLPNYGGKK